MSINHIYKQDLFLTHIKAICSLAECQTDLVGPEQGSRRCTCSQDRLCTRGCTNIQPVKQQTHVCACDCVCARNAPRHTKCPDQRKPTTLANACLECARGLLGNSALLALYAEPGAWTVGWYRLWAREGGPSCVQPHKELPPPSTWGLSARGSTEVQQLKGFLTLYNKGTSMNHAFT